jgi:outer membrane protein
MGARGRTEETDMARLTGAAAAVVLLAALGTVPPARAQAQGPQGQPLKLAYINSQVILANTPGRAEAESTFNREMAGYQAQVQTLQAQLDTAVAEYNRTSLVMSPSAKQQREQQIRDMEARTRQQVNDLQQRAQQREQELTAPIMQRVTAVIEGIRAEFNYSMIFDAAASNGVLVSADRSLDISPLVIQRLQAGAGAATPGAAATPDVRPTGAPPLPADSTRARPDSLRARPDTSRRTPARPRP